MSRYAPQRFVPSRPVVRNDPPSKLPKGLVDQFIASVSSGNMTEVSSFVMEHKNNWDAVDPTGNSPVHTLLRLDKSVANNAKKLAALRFLAENGASLESPAPGNVWPIHLAVATGSVKIVQFMIDRGVRTDRVDSAGNNIVHYAIYGKKTSCPVSSRPQSLQPPPTLEKISFNKLLQEANQLVLEDMKDPTIVSLLTKMGKTMREVPKMSRAKEFIDNIQPSISEIFLENALNPNYAGNVLDQQSRLASIINEIYSAISNEIVKGATAPLDLAPGNGGWSLDPAAVVNDRSRITRTTIDQIRKDAENVQKGLLENVMNESSGLADREGSKGTAVDFLRYFQSGGPRLEGLYRDYLVRLLFCPECGPGEYYGSRTSMARFFLLYLYYEFHANYGTYFGEMLVDSTQKLMTVPQRQAMLESLTYSIRPDPTPLDDDLGIIPVVQNNVQMTVDSCVIATAIIEKIEGNTGIVAALIAVHVYQMEYNYAYFSVSNGNQAFQQEALNVLPAAIAGQTAWNAREQARNDFGYELNVPAQQTAVKNIVKRALRSYNAGLAVSDKLSRPDLDAIRDEVIKPGAGITEDYIIVFAVIRKGGAIDNSSLESAVAATKAANAIRPTLDLDAYIERAKTLDRSNTGNYFDNLVRARGGNPNRTYREVTIAMITQFLGADPWKRIIDGSDDSSIDIEELIDSLIAGTPGRVIKQRTNLGTRNTIGTSLSVAVAYNLVKGGKGADNVLLDPRYLTTVNIQTGGNNYYQQLQKLDWTSIDRTFDYWTRADGYSGTSLLSSTTSRLMGTIGNTAANLNSLPKQIEDFLGLGGGARPSAEAVIRDKFLSMFSYSLDNLNYVPSYNRVPVDLLQDNEFTRIPVGKLIQDYQLETENLTESSYTSLSFFGALNNLLESLQPLIIHPSNLQGSNSILRANDRYGDTPYLSDYKYVPLTPFVYVRGQGIVRVQFNDSYTYLDLFVLFNCIYQLLVEGRYTVLKNNPLLTEQEIGIWDSFVADMANKPLRTPDLLGVAPNVYQARSGTVGAFFPWFIYLYRLLVRMTTKKMVDLVGSEINLLVKNIAKNPAAVNTVYDNNYLNHRSLKRAVEAFVERIPSDTQLYQLYFPGLATVSGAPIFPADPSRPLWSPTTPDLRGLQSLFTSMLRSVKTRKPLMDLLAATGSQISIFDTWERVRGRFDRVCLDHEAGLRILFGHSYQPATRGGAAPRGKSRASRPAPSPESVSTLFRKYMTQERLQTFLKLIESFFDQPGNPQLRAVDLYTQNLSSTWARIQVPGANPGDPLTNLTPIPPPPPPPPLPPPPPPPFPIVYSSTGLRINGKPGGNPEQMMRLEDAMTDTLAYVMIDFYLRTRSIFQDSALINKIVQCVAALLEKKTPYLIGQFLLPKLITLVIDRLVKLVEIRTETDVQALRVKYFFSRIGEKDDQVVIAQLPGIWTQFIDQVEGENQLTYQNVNSLLKYHTGITQVVDSFSSSRLMRNTNEPSRYFSAQLPRIGTLPESLSDFLDDPDRSLEILIADYRVTSDLVYYSDNEHEVRDLPLTVLFSEYVKVPFGGTYHKLFFGPTTPEAGGHTFNGQVDVYLEGISNTVQINLIAPLVSPFNLIVNFPVSVPPNPPSVPVFAVIIVNVSDPGPFVLTNGGFGTGFIAYRKKTTRNPNDPLPASINDGLETELMIIKQEIVQKSIELFATSHAPEYAELQRLGTSSDVSPDPVRAQIIIGRLSDTVVNKSMEYALRRSILDAIMSKVDSSHPAATQIYELIRTQTANRINLTSVEKDPVEKLLTSLPAEIDVALPQIEAEPNKNLDPSTFIHYLYNINYYSGNVKEGKTCFVINPKIVERLALLPDLVRKANINGEIPLHLAVSSVNPRLVKILSSTSPPVVLNYRNRFGESAIDLCLKLLESHLGYTQGTTVAQTLSGFSDAFNQMLLRSLETGPAKNNVVLGTQYAIPIILCIYQHMQLNYLRNYRYGITYQEFQDVSGLLPGLPRLPIDLFQLSETELKRCLVLSDPKDRAIVSVEKMESGRKRALEIEQKIYQNQIDAYNLELKTADTARKAEINAALVDVNAKKAKVDAKLASGLGSTGSVSSATLAAYETALGGIETIPSTKDEIEFYSEAFDKVSKISAVRLEIWKSYLDKENGRAPSLLIHQIENVVQKCVGQVRNTISSKGDWTPIKKTLGTLEQYLERVKQYISAKSAVQNIDDNPALKHEYDQIVYLINLILTPAIRNILINQASEGIMAIVPGMDINIVVRSLVALQRDGQTLDDYLTQTLPMRACKFYNLVYDNPQDPSRKISRREELYEPLIRILLKTDLTQLTEDSDLVKNLRSYLVPFMADTYEKAIHHLRLALYSYEKYLSNTWQLVRMLRILCDIPC